MFKNMCKARLSRAAVLASIGVHSPVLWLLFFVPQPRTASPNLPSVEVEFRQRANTKSNTATRGIPPPVRLNGLIPKLKLDPRRGSAWTMSGSLDEDTPVHQQLLGAGNLSREHSRFVQQLWLAVDRNIEENPFLSEYNRTGQVKMRLEFDARGRLVSLNATAVDRVLKVIAARAIRKALNDELPPTRRPLRVYATFTWSSYGACTGLRGQSGSHLSFCHYAENKRRKFTTRERFGTWAGAILTHGPWAVEEIKKYNREERRRQDQFNPFRHYELDPDWNL